MALSVNTCQDKVALGVDSATGERGFLVKMVNKTGVATVKGSVICPSPTTDNSFALQYDMFDSIGVVAEAGVADASEAWVWVNGSICQVLFEDTKASTREYVAIAAATDGRAEAIPVPTVSPAAAEHFKEIGHTMESVSAGTDILVLCHLHFN